MIQAALDVGIEYPLAGALAVHACVESRQGIHRASPWSESVGVRLKAAFPFGFQGHFNERLHDAILLGRNTHSTLHLYPSRLWNR